MSKYLPLIQHIGSGEEKPSTNGWWSMLCPFHKEKTPSFHVDSEKGSFSCKHPECVGGGNIWMLLTLVFGKETGYSEKQKKDWADYVLDKFSIDILGVGSNGKIKVSKKPPQAQAAPLPAESKVKQWNLDLMSASTRLAYMAEHRGWAAGTILDMKIGWDGERYTIPIYRGGQLVNVRRYNPTTNDPSKKIFNLKGHGGGVKLLPESAFASENKVVWFCEGEPDCIALRSLGINAITTTHGSGSIPEVSDISLFSGKTVYIIYDNDPAGVKGSKRIYRYLRDACSAIKLLDVGILLQDTEGKDVTDAIIRGGKKRGDFEKLADTTKTRDSGRDETINKIKIEEIDEYIGKSVQFQALILAKAQNGTVVPTKVCITCNAGADYRQNFLGCTACNWRAAEIAGKLSENDEFEWYPNIDDWLEFIKCRQDKVKKVILGRACIGCENVHIEERDQSVLDELKLGSPIRSLSRGVHDMSGMAGVVERTAYALGPHHDVNQIYELAGMAKPAPWDRTTILVMDKSSRVDEENQFYELTKQEREELSDLFDLEKIDEDEENEQGEEQSEEAADEKDVVEKNDFEGDEV